MFFFFVFCVCVCVTFVLSLILPHHLHFLVPGKAELRDCAISLVQCNFIIFFTAVTAFIAACMLFCTPKPSENGSTLTGKACSLKRAFFFFFFILEKTLFQMNGKHFVSIASPLNVSIALNSYERHRVGII